MVIIGVHDHKNTQLPNIQALTPLVLTMRYREYSEIRKVPELAKVCHEGGFDPQNARPIFAWRFPDDVDFGPEIPLVFLSTANGKIEEELDFRCRRTMRSSIQPHVGWGTAVVILSDWKDWKPEPDSDRIGKQLKVETSLAGFTKPPCYFALLRMKNESGRFVDRPLGMPIHITDAKLESFVFRVLFCDELEMPDHEFIKALEADRKSQVIWWGIEVPLSNAYPILGTLLPISPLFSASSNTGNEV